MSVGQVHAQGAQDAQAYTFQTYPKLHKSLMHQRVQIWIPFSENHVFTQSSIFSRRILIGEFTF